MKEKSLRTHCFMKLFPTLATKMAVVYTFSYVSRLSASGGDNSVLNACINERVWQVAVISTRVYRPHPPSQALQRARYIARSVWRSRTCCICWWSLRFQECTERCTALCTLRQENMDNKSKMPATVLVKHLYENKQHIKKRFVINTSNDFCGHLHSRLENSRPGKIVSCFCTMVLSNIPRAE